MLNVNLSKWEKVPGSGRSESLDKRLCFHKIKLKQTRDLTIGFTPTKKMNLKQMWANSLDNRFYSHKKEGAQTNA